MSDKIVFGHFDIAYLHKQPAFSLSSLRSGCELTQRPHLKEATQGNNQITGAITLSLDMLKHLRIGAIVIGIMDFWGLQ